MEDYDSSTYEIAWDGGMYYASEVGIPQVFLDAFEEDGQEKV